MVSSLPFGAVAPPSTAAAVTSAARSAEPFKLSPRRINCNLSSSGFPVQVSPSQLSDPFDLFCSILWLPPLFLLFVSSSIYDHGLIVSFMDARGCSSRGPASAAAAQFPPEAPSSLKPRSEITEGANNDVLFAHGRVERIRDALLNVELSVSSYDTAWVAMVPSLGAPQLPCFPQCIDWILENQNLDGSWGLSCHHTSLMKVALSSTLACILALKRWSVGEEHVKKGIHFIGSNFSLTADERQHSPIGFDIIFPGMIWYAKRMGLDIPIDQTDIDTILHMRELELKRISASNSKGKKAYLAYVAEGLDNFQDWEEIMKYQRKNGSLFNSPSTTAAVLIHHWDAKCHQYLHLLLEKFGNAVPTKYPLDIYTHLRMVDHLGRMGIAQHFRDEIKNILDETHRCWLLGDEEISLDIATCSIAFRLLRMNGYEISSGLLAEVGEEELFYNSVEGYLKDTNTVLELHKASQIKIFQNDCLLEKLNLWSSHFLTQKTSNNKMHISVTDQEVDSALKFPFYRNLERLEHKRYIEHFNVDNIQILKASYMLQNIDSKDILELAVEEYNISQSVYRKELELLERWIKENRLDQLNFARQKLSYCYFSAAATLFHPEISDARISWAKNGVLTTVVDDFFDVGGSRDELVDLIQLVERWDENCNIDCCSEQVKIVYSAIRSTIDELGAKASAMQGRSVTSHIIEILLDLMRSMMRESEWQKDKVVPTMEQYMTNGYVSFALGPIILPALYFMGPKLSGDVIKDPEYHNLYKLVSTCGRLLNDMQTFEREGKDGKLNSVSLFMREGAISEEEAKREMRRLIDSNRTELLRLVLANEGSVVPRACKDLFWKMSRILHLFYMRNDGFTSPKEMVSSVNAVIYEPLKVPAFLSADV